MSLNTQVNMSCGVTIVATSDNVLFPFATDFLVQYPINMIVSNTIGIGNLTGINVIKVPTNSATIQLYMYLVTGFALQPLCYYEDSSSNIIPITPNLTSSTIETLTNIKTENEEPKSSIYYKGDGLDILDDDEIFTDFDAYVAETSIDYVMDDF